MDSSLKTFSSADADRWWMRNRNNVAHEVDYVVEAISRIRWPAGLANSKVLEVGCAAGHRLNALTRQFKGEIPIAAGVDISPRAIATGRKLFPHLHLEVASADSLPFEDASMGTIILGFFLTYLPPSSYLRVFMEADRVLADNGLLVVQDFMPARPGMRPYGHSNALTTRKARFGEMLLGHPCYTLVHRELHLGPNALEFPQSDQRQGIDILHKLESGAFESLPVLPA